MIVKIIKCSNHIFWYYDKVGQVLEVDEQEKNGFYNCIGFCANIKKK